MPSVAQWLKNTVGSHEKNRVILARPANNPEGDAKTMTSSEFPACRGTKMKCIRSESPRKPPLRPEWGASGVSNEWCIILFEKKKNILSFLLFYEIIIKSLTFFSRRFNIHILGVRVICFVAHSVSLKLERLIIKAQPLTWQTANSTQLLVTQV